MADNLKTLTAEYDKLAKACGTLVDEMGEAGKAVSKANATLKNTMAGLRERIQELKNDGAMGKSIKDFIADRDVRMMYAMAQNYTQSTGSNRAHTTDGHKKKVKELLADHRSLKERTAKLLKDGEKGKAKVDEDDLNGLRKLQASIAKLETDKRGTKRLASYELDAGDDDAKSLDDRLKAMIADIKPDKSKARKPMVKDYDAKSLKTMKKDFDGIVRESGDGVAEALKASKGGDAAKLEAALKTLEGQLEDLEEIEKHCKKGTSDQKLAASIAEAPEGKANLAIMEDILKRIEKPMKSIRSAKKLKAA